MIRVKQCSIFVDDQEKALQFYTTKIGFEKKAEEPVGDHKWITVGQTGEDFELVLEPDVHPAAKTFKEALYKDNIPATMLYVEDLDKCHADLSAKGVEFKTPPTDAGKVKIAIFDDTCGNCVMLCQK